jgi:hypothetical protein
MPYLMDDITRIGALVRSSRNGDALMRGYADLADKLVGTPRFLLDADACRTCVELNLGRPKVILETLAHLTIPYPRIWVEWDDSDRARLREHFPWEELTLKELRPMPGRVGFLLEAEGPRRGTATWAWTTPNGPSTKLGLDKHGLNIPNIGAVQPYFDLDQTFELGSELDKQQLKLAMLWQDHPVQLRALFDIWRTCEHKPSRWGQHHIAALGGGDLVRALCYSDVVGEYIMLWAFLLLLTSSRKTIDLRPVDRAKLNKARAKKREVLLLDHTLVTMHVDPYLRQAQTRQPLGYQRKSPRVHLVSSYLARRGNRHWIVQPYMRGSGETIHRVTQVRR